MDMLESMLKRIDWPSIALLLTFSLFSFASFYPLFSMWGINHLAFLPDVFTYLFWSVVIAVLVLIVAPISPTSLDRVLSKTADFIWEKGPWPKLLIVAIFTVTFIVFKSETHFLGDGYGWLSLFGSGEGYYHKWSEPGSILLVRQLQRLIGGYTEQTALRTFQILSILSGAIVIFNLISVLKRLCHNDQARIFGLITLLGSGSMLLFFGYVEFYPVLWAAATTFINMSVKYLINGRGILWVLVSFIGSILMHMQALYFIGGFAFVLFSGKFMKRRMQALPARWLIAFLIISVGGMFLFHRFYMTRIDVETVFLPLFTGRPQSPEYAIFTLKHLADVINLVFLLFPGFLVILVLWLRKDKKPIFNLTTIFLALLSVGSLAFFFTVDPILGMARDWDLMSLCLLPPMLLLLHNVAQGSFEVSRKTILTYALTCIFITASFVTAATVENPSADRFYSLLHYYGRKDRSGWAIFAYYQRDQENQKIYQEILKEMDGLFPEYRELRRAYAALGKGDYQTALILAQALVNKDPYDADFLQLLGNVQGKLGNYDVAEELYNKAIKLKPHPAIMNELGQLYLQQQKYSEALAVFKKAHRRVPQTTFIAEGVGLTYIRLGHLDSASAVADTLFLQDLNSPGGHLIRMVVALQQENYQKAKQHFQEYLKYGSDRSDYKKICDYYGYLIDY